MQLEHYVQSKDLSAIHNEDVILSAAASELLTQADTIASNQSGDFKTSLTTFCSRVSALHLVADLNQQANAETELGKVLKSFSNVKAHFSKEVIASAQVYLETFTCPMHRDVVGKRTDFCPKCGMALDQLCRILPEVGLSSAGQQTVRASIIPRGADRRQACRRASPLAKIQWRSRLASGSDRNAHEENPSVHRRQQPDGLSSRTSGADGNPGEYSFSFTPSKPGGYRVWADVRPHPLGLQEYAMADIPSTTAGEP